jgi:hypothetical protein
MKRKNHNNVNCKRDIIKKEYLQNKSSPLKAMNDNYDNEDKYLTMRDSAV